MRGDHYWCSHLFQSHLAYFSLALYTIYCLELLDPFFHHASKQNRWKFEGNGHIERFFIKYVLFLQEKNKNKNSGWISSNSKKKNKQTFSWLECRWLLLIFFFAYLCSTLFHRGLEMAFKKHTEDKELKR